MLRERFNEGASGFIRAQIVDQTGTPVDADAFTSATLTLYDMETYLPGSPAEGILNDRDAQDILGVGSPPAEMNNVVYQANGYFQWNLQPEDNVIVNPRRQIERHRAVFRFTWATGSFPYEIEIEVVNLRSVA